MRCGDLGFGLWWRLLVLCFSLFEKYLFYSVSAPAPGERHTARRGSRGEAEGAAGERRGYVHRTERSRASHGIPGGDVRATGLDAAAEEWAHVPSRARLASREAAGRTT
jgi:hypothetical protein